MNRGTKGILASILFSLLLIGLRVEDVSAINNEENRNFKRITIGDGLSQTTIKSIFQDSNGYMWLGTSDGLNKYNGHKFEVYKSKKDEENSLSGNQVTDIAEDLEGNIWVATTKGLNKINNDKSKSITNYLSNKNGCNISNNQIKDILVSKEGDILIATENGLNKYDKKNDNFIRLYDSKDEDYSLSNQFINSIAEDNNGYYWVGTKEGLNRISKDTNKVVKYYANDEDENAISSNYIYKVYIDDLNFLWIGTYYAGLNKIDLSNGKVEKFMASKDTNSIAGNYVKDILRDSRNIVWIATDHGLSKLDEKTNNFTTYRSKGYDNRSLSSNEVLSLYESKVGTIWIGTWSGASLFNPDNLFNHYKNDPLNKNSLSENMISGIYEDNEELLWIGTNHNGINIFDRKNNEVTRINNNSDISLSNDLVRDITGINNEIWIATEYGLNKLDKSTNKITVYKEEDGLSNNDVRSLYIDSEETLWIGTKDGLCSFDRKNKFTNYTEIFKQIGVNKDSIADIVEDKDKTMWFAGGVEGELIKYDKATKKVKSYNFVRTSEQSNDTVLSVNADSKGNIWVGTDYGLIKFNKESEEITRYTEYDGLANNFVYGVILDKYEDVWISTNYGISKFDVHKEKFINFDSTDGLQSNEFNQYSYYKSKNGEIFFGGINGLTSFVPETLKEKYFTPDVTIEDISSNGELLSLTSDMKLSYENNQLQFNFFVPDYRNTSKIQYAYKLSGLDKDWVFSENRNNASYTNLEPGKYTFEVVGRNSSGKWSNPSQINIEIENPLWKTPIAYMGYISILLGIVFIVWNRVKILDGLVKQRTIELNKKLAENKDLYLKLLKQEKYKNNYFVNLSHELRTPLNVIVSIRNLIENLNKKEEHIPKEKISHHMKIMDKNCNRLISLIDNIIHTSKIESGSYKLNIKKYDIIYLVEEAVLSMKDYIEEKGIQLIIEPDIEEKYIECDNLEIERTIINLISNAIKFTKPKGKIEVNIWDLGKAVRISVKDTGIGIDPKYHESIFDRFTQAYEDTTEEYGGNGLGLTLSRQIIELHRGKIYVESELGLGSEFIVILPIKQSKEFKLKIENI
ncbi:sensor histidine kinase [Clostridium sp. CCUG 7971]|uniref:ligand-binding sensor domain-containing protein n=1 Tax=Clostridium sp. CCUG 7971 TaxID=2811414 RepID=UPI001ABA1E13|nr:sensor histidine kinase [Clostridium sp. CCUG 7971]MBO3444255.1 histidine kinase [Clostridium sp. CCUG 7971]